MVRINLLPIREILRRRELKQFILMASVALAAVVGVMLVTYLFFSFKQSSLEAEKKGLTVKLQKLKEQNKRIQSLEDEINRLQKQVKTVEQLTKIRDTPAPFMSALAQTIPDEVWVGSITKTGKSFSLDGTGLDNTVVVKFVENLQKIRQGFTAESLWVNPKDPNSVSFFTNVKLVQIVATGGAGGAGTMNFKITGNVR